MGGFAAAIELGRLLPQVFILFYSIHEGALLVKQAKDIGVRGFVTKSRISDTLFDAVDTLVIRKDSFFPTSLKYLEISGIGGKAFSIAGSGLTNTIGRRPGQGSTKCFNAVTPATSPVQPQ
jgi:two-component system, NarL family, invasion response regulator UvrY